MENSRIKQYQQIDYIKLFALCKERGIVKAKRKTPAQSEDPVRPCKLLFSEFIKKTFSDFKFKSDRRYRRYIYLMFQGGGHKYISISRDINNIERTSSIEYQNLMQAFNLFLQGGVGILNFNMNSRYYYNNSYISITFEKSRKWEELCRDIGSYNVSRQDFSAYESAIALLQFKDYIEEKYNNLLSILETYKEFLKERQKNIIVEKQQKEENKKTAQDLFNEAAKSLGRI